MDTQGESEDPPTGYPVSDETRLRESGDAVCEEAIEIDEILWIEGVEPIEIVIESEGDVEGEDEAAQ